MFKLFSSTTQFYIYAFLDRLIAIELNNEQADFLISKIEERRAAKT